MFGVPPAANTAPFLDFAASISAKLEAVLSLRKSLLDNMTFSFPKKQTGDSQ
jgi:hypothetical protein